jgi:hypothetical protein
MIAEGLSREKWEISEEVEISVIFPFERSFEI